MNDKEYEIRKTEIMKELAQHEINSERRNREIRRLLRFDNNE